MIPRGPVSMPTFSRASESMFGRRPAASRICSTCHLRSSPLTCPHSVLPLSSESTLLSSTPSSNLTPSSSSRCCRISASSGSSWLKIRSAISSTRTWTPSRFIACAISMPTGPAPTMASEAGARSCSNTFSLVRGSAPARPSTGGKAGRDPVQTRANLVATARPAIWTQRPPAKEASPHRMSTPNLAYLSVTVDQAPHGRLGGGHGTRTRQALVELIGGDLRLEELLAVQHHTEGHDEEPVSLDQRRREVACGIDNDGDVADHSCVLPLAGTAFASALIEGLRNGGYFPLAGLPSRA